MDAFLLTRALDRETYVNPNARKMSLLSIIQLILSLAISVYAGFLAWNVGSSDHTFFRILMTITAFMFSTLYIIGYLIVKLFK